jgi:hypothetical protein
MAAEPVRYAPAAQVRVRGAIAAEAPASSPADAERVEPRVVEVQAERHVAAQALHRAPLVAPADSSDGPVQVHFAAYQAVTAVNTERSSVADPSAANLQALVAGSAGPRPGADPGVRDAVRRASGDCFPAHSDGSCPPGLVDSRSDYLDLPPARCSQEQPDVRCPERLGGSQGSSAVLLDHCHRDSFDRSVDHRAAEHLLRGDSQDCSQQVRPSFRVRHCDDCP